MPSPFPGMDPYLEHPAFWNDFHHTFITCWREVILDSLPENYDATLEPVTVTHVILDEPSQAYIEIINRPDQSLVAVLELLSPANKENPGRLAYLAKRQALLHQQVHLIELDLLLGGRRVPAGEPLPWGDYYYFLSRGDQRPHCQVYAWPIRQPLPTLPVPLQLPDPDLLIDLGAVFNLTYKRGGFGRRLRYQEPPPVRRSEEEIKRILGQGQEGS